MKELEMIYEYLGKLEEGYSVEGDMLLMAARDKVYYALAQLEECIASKNITSKIQLEK